MTMFVRELRLVLMALQFLTRLPVPAWVGYEPALMSRAVRHFPLVGALIGIASAAPSCRSIHVAPGAWHIASAQRQGGGNCRAS